MMSTAQTAQTRRAATSSAAATPRQLGVGMRFSIHPHSDNFVDVILGALQDAEEAGLTDALVVETDEVSTYVGALEAPAEQRLVAYLAAVIGAASRRSGGGHVVAQVLLSRGCPGEVACDLSVTGLPHPDPVQVRATGVSAVAQWSLYPLLDGGSDAGGHMDHIETAITAARRRGTAVGATHYATMLRADVAEVLATAADGWSQVGSAVAHVVCHLTVSVGSPGLAVDQ